MRDQWVRRDGPEVPIRSASQTQAVPAPAHDWAHALQWSSTHLARIPNSRRLMALWTALTLIVYLWNMPRALDLPEYDEAAYFFRGYHLALGDLSTADIANPNTSPLSVVWYAVWYLMLHTTLLYPWVMASCLFLMGMGAYLLLSRMLPPVLSWILALMAIVGSAPIVPWNANYYLGTGVLWLSLAVLDHRPWRRGLGVLGVLIAMYARPELAVVLVTLMLALAVYEVLQYRQHKVALRSLVFGYAPLTVGLLLSAYLLMTLPAGSDYRSSAALPWSYNDFYNVEHHAEFHGADSYANPWVLFEKDFGPVKPRTVVNTMVALQHNPTKAREYLTFEAVRLWASFGTSALYSLGWHSDEWETKLQVTITAQDTWQFGLGMGLFFAVAGACYWWLAHRRKLGIVRVTPHGPALLGVGSLAALLVPLVLINPHQRFFMLFPLALLMVGYSLLVIWATAVDLLTAANPALHSILPASAQATRVLLLIVLVALALPQPYLTTSVHPIERTLALLRSHVPNGSTIVGEPVISYGYYLSAQGMHLHAISPADYPGAGLVGAFEADPSLRYALLTRIYPQSTYDQWFADWKVIFPRLPWTLVAQERDPALQLYALPPHGSGYGQVSYALWLLQTRQLKLETAQLPRYDALDFDDTTVWQSDNPGHTVQPLVRSVAGVPASSFIMHPYYPGLSAYPDVSSQVEANLPPEWSGRILVFFAALAPWAASQPDAKGVTVVVSANSIGYSHVVQVLNDSPPHWTPIIVHLPHYIGSLTLKIAVQPRGPISNDTTLISFIGVTRAAA